MISCMGGWCRSREKCAHYVTDFPVISERLCGEYEEPESVRHLLAGVSAPMSCPVDPAQAGSEPGSWTHRVVWGRQALARMEGQRPESV